MRDRQRNQPKAGRLDLLLEDTQKKRRYEVEIQLGRSNESHIIRTIKYWDFERKRYPQYEHCAVIVAEDVTTRFLNVINLLNGIIPFIAIKMEAYQIHDDIALIFTKIIDELQLGLDDTGPNADRGTYSRANWEKDVSPVMLEIVDEIFEKLHGINSKYELTYKKYYIGLSYAGNANNIVLFRPKKNFRKLSVCLKQSENLEKPMEASGIEVIDYDARWHGTPFGLRPTRLRKTKN